MAAKDTKKVRNSNDAMRNMKTATKLVIGFGIVALLTVGLGIFAYIQLDQVDDNYNAVFEDEVNSVYYMGQINTAITGERSDLRGMMIYVEEGDQESLQKMETRLMEKRASIVELVPKYQQTIEGQNELQRDFEATDKLYKAYVAKSEEFMAAARGMDKATALTSLNALAADLDAVLESVAFLADTASSYFFRSQYEI